MAGIESLAGKATPWGAIGTGVSAVTDLAKMGIGLAQYIKGTKAMNKLLANRPTWNISQGYKTGLGLFGLYAAQNMPGYGQTMGAIEQSTAKTIANAKVGAISQSQYMDAVLGSQDRELEAIRNLGITSAQWKGQQQQNYAGAQMQFGQLQDEAQQKNVFDPYNMQLTMANEQRQAGNQNLWGGANNLQGSLSDYFGTKYYGQALQGLYGNKNTTPSGSAFPNGGTQNSSYQSEYDRIQQMKNNSIKI